MDKPQNKSIGTKARGAAMVSKAATPAAIVSAPDGAQPLYARVLHALRQEIVQGVYPVDSRLPPEDDLCKRFNVSRHTVREALRRLRDEGLVASRQGAGTTVSRASASSSYATEVATINDLLAFAAGTRYEIEVTEMVECDAMLAARIGGQVGQKWLHVAGLRRSPDDSVSICWVEAYVAAEYAGIGRLLSRHSGPIFELIENMYGETVAQVRQELSARPARQQEASRLGMAQDATVIEVMRVYRLMSGPICEIAFNVYAPEQFRMSITLNRSRG